MPSAILSFVMIGFGYILAGYDMIFGTEHAPYAVVYLNEAAEFIVEAIGKIIFGIFQ